MDAPIPPSPEADSTLAADALPKPVAAAVASAEHGSRIALMRGDRAVAFLVPVEDAEALERFEDAADARLAQEARAEWVAAGRPLGATLLELASRWEIDLAANAE